MTPRDATDRVYLPRQTIALGLALVSAGATAGAGYAYQASQMREALAEIRTQSQSDNRDVSREVCLLRAQMKATGFTVICRGDLNYSASRSSIGGTASYYASEGRPGMDQRTAYYLVVALIVLSLIGIGFLVRTFGQYMTVDREKIRASRALEKAMQSYLDELQAYRKKRTGTRHSPITGFPRMDDPEHLREEGGM